MSNRKWTALSIAAVVALGTAACSDNDNDNDFDAVDLPIPGNAEAYFLSKEGSAFTVTRLYNADGGNTTGPDQTITGLPVGEDLVGMDFRPRDGKLYLVGRNGATAESLGAIYVINTLPTTGNLTATVVSQLVPTPEDLTTPFTGLSSSASYGVDFNPQANALRLVSSTGENLRIPFGGAGEIPVQLTVTTDTALTLSGNAKSGIVAAAYTNNFNTAASTALLVLSGNELFLQSLPNDGTLTSRGMLTRDGSAIEPAAPGLSFDILTVGGVDTGFFFGQSSVTRNEAAFGTINLTTGALTVLADTDDVDGDETLLGLAMKAPAL